MRTFATLVLYERHGQPAMGYRAETIDQIVHGDMAEGTHGAWELRCWTPAGPQPSYGVRAQELVALVGATFRVIDHCLRDNGPLEAIRRFHCVRDSVVADLPSSRPLHEHLMAWSDQAASNDVFLQIRGADTARLQAIGHQLQREIEAMVKVNDELFGHSAPAVPSS